MHRPSHGALLAIALVVVTACAGGRDDSVSPEAEAAVLRLAEPAADALAGALRGRLLEAMQEGGPAAAIDVCSERALEITRRIETEQGLAIKRTSFRYRNPLNAPDEDEARALRHFESAAAETGEVPDFWVQKASRSEYRYYRPLSVAPPCLACHGAPADIDPAVAQVLGERYPDDLATGYEAGDFRGAIRVSIPADRVEPAS